MGVSVSEIPWLGVMLLCQSFSSFLVSYYIGSANRLHAGTYDYGVDFLACFGACEVVSVHGCFLLWLGVIAVTLLAAALPVTVLLHAMFHRVNIFFQSFLAFTIDSRLILTR